MIPSLVNTRTTSLMDSTTTDVRHKIIFMAAQVMQNLRYASDVFVSKFFQSDGPKAISALCESLKTLEAWRTTSKLSKEESDLMKTHMKAILEALQSFRNKVSWWQPPSESEAHGQFKQFQEQCALLDLLPTMMEQGKLEQIAPPPLSRARANQGDFSHPSTR